MIYDFRFMIFSGYIAEDCHGPLGLAMTDYGVFRQNTNLKKQSQFSNVQNEFKYLYEREIYELLWFWAARKQSQFKAKRACPERSRMEPILSFSVSPQDALRRSPRDCVQAILMTHTLYRNTR